MKTEPPLPAWCRTAIAAYDWVYRVSHGLNAPESEVGPVLRVEVRRSRWSLELSDGTIIRPGDPIGFLHTNNERVLRLHSDGLAPTAIGFEFRRRFMLSLQCLAALAQPGGRLGGLRAFAATTIFYGGLAFVGFEVEPGGLRWPRLVAAYQRMLLLSLNLGNSARLRAPTHERAERVWISRQKLIRRYGGAASR